MSEEAVNIVYEKEHSDLVSPSSVYRQLACEACILPPVNPVRISTKASDRGTKIHGAFEDYMRSGEYPDTNLADDELEIAALMVETCTPYTVEGTYYHVEARVELNENIFGSVDFVAYNESTRYMTVIDLKTGTHPVSPTENLQLLTYAVLARATFGYDPKFVDLKIVQGDEVKSWLCETSALDKHRDVLLELEQRLLKVREAGEGVETAGGWCYFCKRKLDCKAYRETNLQPALDLLTDLTVPSKEDIQKFHNDKLSEYYTLSKLANTLFEQVKDEMKLRLKEGQKVHGYELKVKNTRSFIEDTQFVAETLQGLGIAKPFEVKLKGIGDIEKVIGKNKIPNDLVTKTESVSIVPSKALPESLTSLEKIKKVN